MNKRKRAGRYLLLFLFMLGLLTGCKENDKKKEATVETEELDEAQKNQEMEEDGRVLMTVGEEEVSLEEARIYIFFLKKQYESRIGSVIWDYKLDGNTIGEYGKEQVKELLTQVKITKQVAEKEEITLSEDELEEAISYSKEYLAGLTKEEKESYNLNEELLTKIYEENILANKIFDITTNDVDINISEEEARQITIQYLMVMTKGTDRNGIAVDMNEEEKAEAKSKAKKLLKEAKDTANFLTFAESNTDAPEVQLTFAKADAPEELKETAFGLGSGQLSSLVTGENGYYIVYCVSDNDEDATAAKKEELILERQRISFEKKFTQWSADYEIVISTPLWEELIF